MSFPFILFFFFFPISPALNSVNPFNLRTQVFLQLREMAIHYLSNHVLPQFPFILFALLLLCTLRLSFLVMIFISLCFCTVSSTCQAVIYVIAAEHPLLWSTRWIVCFQMHPSAMLASPELLWLWLLVCRPCSVSHSCSVLLGMSSVCCE